MEIMILQKHENVVLYQQVPISTMSTTKNSTTEFMSEEGKVNKRGKSLPQFIAAITVCLGALAAGTTLAWVVNISEELQNGEFNGMQITEINLSWIGSLVPFGAMVMCFPIGIMCDTLGRKLALLIFTIPFFGGWLLIIFANSLAMLYVGRFTTGMAAGAFCVAVPLYTTEIAEKEIRGKLSCYFSLLLVCGGVSTSTMGYALPIKNYTIVLSSFPLIFAAIFVFQPESPIYRMKQKREDQAKAVLVRLRGSFYNVDNGLQEIRESLKEKETNKITFKDSIKKKGTKKAVVVCFSLMFFQQVGGITAIIVYSSDVFRSAGVSLDPKICTIILGIVTTASIFVSSLVIDKVGRRILLLISGFSMAVGLLIFAVFFMLKERGLASEDTLSNLGFVPLLGLCICNIVFSLGYGPIPWIMSAEFFPPEIKSTTTAAAGTFNWFMAFLMSKFYVNMKLSVGGDVTFYIFAGICLVGTVFVYFVVPETKNKSLEEIQRELNEKDVEISEYKGRR